MQGRGYNFLSRFIHRLALQYPAIAEMSFDMENAFNKRPAQFTDNAVFITGLARSGTTSLLNYLYETGQFSCLTYRDMPFVLMPNTWKKISGRKVSTSQAERAHQDSITIGLDSPEAFEEVFWRIFCGKDYILTDRLVLDKIDAGVSEKFKLYITNVLQNGGATRYLSKNNINILRIDYLQKAFPGSYIIIPFRDPLQQAISLLNQHQHFSKIQKEDRFTLRYMDWLGHYEFGEGQKPFFLGDNGIFEDLLRYQKNNIDYWLLTWKNYYQFALKRSGVNVIFFDYEKFCADPKLALDKLFLQIGVERAVFEVEPFSTELKSAVGFDEGILHQCRSIYSVLQGRATIDI